MEIILRKWKRAAFAILLVGAISSCANTLNLTTYQRYHAEGAQAEREGNIQLAEAAYSRALGNVYMGNLGKQLESEALFNLGRMQRFTGKYDSSIQHLQKSLAIDDANPASKPIYIQNTLAELAKSYLLKADLSQGLPYLKRSIAILPVSSASPQVQRFISKLCTDYTDSLSAIGQNAEADALKSDACSAFSD